MSSSTRFHDIFERFMVNAICKEWKTFRSKCSCNSQISSLFYQNNNSWNIWKMPKTQTPYLYAHVGLGWQVNDYETVIILLKLHDIYTNIQVGNKYIYICYIEMWKCYVGFMSLDSFVMDQPRIFEQPTYLCTVDWYSKFWLVLLNTYIGKLVTAINSSFL